MKRYLVFFQCFAFIALMNLDNNCFSASYDTIPPRHTVTLNEAHIGDLEIDTRLLDSYLLLPDSIRKFYLSARTVFEGNPDADFTNNEIIEAAREYNLPLIGGPMLGNLTEDGVMLWLRSSTTDPLDVKVTNPDGSGEKTYVINPEVAGVDQKIKVDGLISDTEYKYAIYFQKNRIAEGEFRTAPESYENSTFTLAFGSCFHKIGLHNPNLITQILKREPHAMMLLGDIAVDDRRNRINMHRSDYLLRDVSNPWRQLAANVPLYASWDDHDYFDNDLGGIPEGFTEDDRTAVRSVWQQNWNNPENPHPGIYFNTRIGPVEVIMLDTRSFRENERRGEYGSYLGMEQFNWLKDILKNSDAPFKVISSGTMWSDYITNGKDSWGTWDTKAREELYSFIETEKIPGVLLVSGDRHGARAFTIPRPSGFAFHEFGVASLGGVPGPSAMAEDTSSQLFGYHGSQFVAYGEFTFDTMKDKPTVTFRLIDEYGNILEEHILPYSILSPLE
ncbi:MAG: alkaline phosphatase D family protein [Bacteroidales bacterium]